jgi:hypothetical protein
MAQPEVAKGMTSKVSPGVDGSPGGPRELATAPSQQAMGMDMKGIQALARKVGVQEDQPYVRSSPCVCPCPIVIEQNNLAAVFCCGKYQGTIAKPGLTFLSCFEKPVMVNVAWQALEMKDFKVLDCNGNPIVISGNVSYSFQSAVKPAIDVKDPDNFLRMQAQTCLKKVAAKFRYEAPEGQPCLKSESPEFTTELMQSLQQAILPAGAVILAFELKDLSYAPEVAVAMLQKQQAKAMVEAREIIVHAAVHTTDQALKELKALGHNIDKDAEHRIASNLLTVICSGQHATPTLPLNAA